MMRFEDKIRREIKPFADFNNSTNIILDIIAKNPSQLISVLYTPDTSLSQIQKTIYQNTLTLLKKLNHNIPSLGFMKPNRNNFQESYETWLSRQMQNPLIKLGWMRMDLETGSCGYILTNQGEKILNQYRDYLGKPTIEKSREISRNNFEHLKQSCRF